MAYNNKQQQKKLKNNYFENEIKRNGPDFLSRKNPLDLKRDAIRLFRDMARGNVDVMRYPQYFQNHQFLDSCIQAAQEKFSLHSISFNGVNVMVTSMGINDELTFAVLNYHRMAAEAYQHIITAFTNTKVNSGSPEFLLSLVQILNKGYRNAI